MRAEKGTGTKFSQKMGLGTMGLGMLGRRQVTPRWENDPMWVHDGGIRDIGQGRVRAPSQEENRAEGREGRSGLRRME